MLVLLIKIEYKPCEISKVTMMRKIRYGSYKFFIIAIIISLQVISVYADDDCCDRSHTFFVPRKNTTNSVFELGLTNYHWYHHQERSDEFHLGFYATPFFQQTSKPEEIAQYFLRNNQECLKFSELNEDPCRGICSLWFGIESDVNTHLEIPFTMSPQRRVYGTYYNIMLANGAGLCDFWLNIGFAAMIVEHKLRMCENIKEKAGPLSNFDLGTIDEFESVIAALNNPEWQFGRFCRGTSTRFGVDDIQIKLGYDWYYCADSDNHVSPYLLATIPTGRHQRSKIIFEPLVGSKNGSIGFGVNADYTFFSGEEHDVTWLFDAKYRYAFSADQCRSFDLCENGDWSRYLLIVPEDQHLDTQPGINLFSGKAKVTPQSTIDIWTALHWQYDSCAFELGYDFWWRQQEKVCFNCDIEEGFGIFDLAGMNGAPQSASKANISECATGSNQAPSDPTFVTLKTSDLDIDSAAHPSASSSTLYAAVSWQTEPRELPPLLLGIGGQYEFAHDIDALEQWAIWIKLGIIF